MKRTLKWMINGAERERGSKKMNAIKKLLLVVSVTMVVAMAIPSVVGAEEPTKLNRPMERKNIGLSIESSGKNGVGSEHEIFPHRMAPDSSPTAPTTSFEEVKVTYAPRSGLKSSIPGDAVVARNEGFLVDVDSEDFEEVKQTYAPCSGNMTCSSTQVNRGLRNSSPSVWGDPHVNDFSSVHFPGTRGAVNGEGITDEDDGLWWLHHSSRNWDDADVTHARP